MISRFIRQLLGRTRRAREAEKIHRRRMNLAKMELGLCGKKVRAAEALVKQFQKDILQWPRF